MPSKLTIVDNSTAGPPHKLDPTNLEARDLYCNQELSRLQFNLRVLAQATDERIPLLERLKFLLIFSSNMDEFFEIRVAGQKKQIDFGRENSGLDGMSPREVLRRIHEESHAAFKQQYALLNDVLLPQLAEQGIRILNIADWSELQAQWVRKYFIREVMPVVSPLGLDPAHPFPRLGNKSLNFIVSLSGKDAFDREGGLAIVPAPRSLPRIIKLPEEISNDGDNFIYLSAVIRAHVGDFFPGMTVKECHQFRVTRNSDVEVNDVEVEDIAMALKGELFSRRFGSAVKLEVAAACSEKLSDYLLNQFGLSHEELYQLDGPVNLQRLFELWKFLDRPDISFPTHTPGTSPAIRSAPNLFNTIAHGDILLHHPYQSFSPVVDLLRQAARDPDVLAIRQTLYRTGSTSEIVEALIEAARNHKEVTVVIELRARFDEEENLHFAARLQEAGAVVSYGVLTHKTHAKMMLIVRREQKKLKRYFHLGTGNYHPGNARMYTDYSLLSCNEELGQDVHKVFQQLTGLGKKIKPAGLFHAPFTLRKQLLALIDGEIAAAKDGRPARIICKVNGLTERKIVKALYRASQAGVQVDLIVRGICSLRPGIEGISENIRVKSIVGRFLEHSRVHYFHNSQQPVYLSSADWMDRNLLRRVEVCFPVKDTRLAKNIVRDLELYLKDERNSWDLDADFSYSLNSATQSTGPKICAQEELIQIHRNK